MPYDPKLVHLPGTKLAPEVVLHRTLDKVSSIKSVVVVIQWTDNTLDVDWSQLKVSELALASLFLQEKVQDVIHGRDEDAIFKGGA
jgi:hypothetical protein